MSPVLVNWKVLVRTWQLNFLSMLYGLAVPLSPTTVTSYKHLQALVSLMYICMCTYICTLYNIHLDGGEDVF